MVLKHTQEPLVALGPRSAVVTCLWAVAGSADGTPVLHPSHLSEPPHLYTFPQPDEPASPEVLADAISNESHSRTVSRQGPLWLREGLWSRRTGMSPNWPLLLRNLPADESSQDQQWGIHIKQKWTGKLGVMVMTDLNMTSTKKNTCRQKKLHLEIFFFSKHTLNW